MIHYVILCNKRIFFPSVNLTSTPGSNGDKLARAEVATAPSITSLGRDISAVGQRLGHGECRNASEARGHHVLEGLMGEVVKNTYQ